MVQIFQTREGKLYELPCFEEGAWMHLTDPEDAEVRLSRRNRPGGGLPARRAGRRGKPRVESDGGRPHHPMSADCAAEGRTFVYNTIPLGIIFLIAAS
jgi:hypothetical protein